MNCRHLFDWAGKPWTLGWGRRLGLKIDIKLLKKKSQTEIFVIDLFFCSMTLNGFNRFLSVKNAKSKNWSQTFFVAFFKSFWYSNYFNYKIDIDLLLKRPSHIFFRISNVMWYCKIRIVSTFFEYNNSSYAWQWVNTIMLQALINFVASYTNISDFTVISKPWLNQINQCLKKLLFSDTVE